MDYIEYEWCVFPLLPRRLRNRWGNTLKLCLDMNFIVAHTFREENSYTDKLVAFGLLSKTYTFRPKKSRTYT